MMISRWNLGALFAGLVATLLVAGCITVASIQSPSDKDQSKLKVVLFLDTDCPVAQAYSPRIIALVEEFSSKGVQFEAKFPNVGETPGKIALFFEEFGYSLPWSFDAGAAQAKNLGFKVAPAVALMNIDGKVLYRGAIDDNKSASLVKKNYLEEALESALASKPISQPNSEPFGCILEPGSNLPEINEVTYAKHVAPILNKNCISCHRPGQAAPFSLDSYEAARSKANMLAYVTEVRRMPPYRALEGYGEFSNTKYLSPEEIKTLELWAKNGAKPGDLNSAPSAPKFPAGDWPFGEPDFVFSPDREFILPSETRDVYRHFVIDPKLKEPLYVKAMDVLPGNRRIVHHVIVYLDSTGRGLQLQESATDGQPGYPTFGGPGFLPRSSLGGWAPGMQVQALPPGAAFKINPGDKLVLQVHYHATGKPETDRTKIALYQAEEEIEREVDIWWMADPFIKIPAGEERHVVRKSFQVRTKSKLYGVMPHMHLLGRSMKAWAKLPNGETKPLVWIDDWDFNWQMNYQFKEPIELPRGTEVIVEARFDNSSKNPNNPNDPPQQVRWGEQTTDEMFLLVGMVSRDSAAQRLRERVRDRIGN